MLLANCIAETLLALRAKDQKKLILGSLICKVEAMSKVVEYLKAENIVHGIPSLANIENIEHSAKLEVFPSDRTELKKLIVYLFDLKMEYHVISTGCNWGLGSKWTDKSVIINLSNLNKIVLMEEFGVVRIEPGVTQVQLGEYLKSVGSNYFLDVTGSSQYSSIVGNTLERGIAYNSQRTKAVRNLQVLLKNGEEISTGLGEGHEEGINHLYEYSLGPDLTGLFFQSDFGIVTELSLKLKRKKDSSCFIQLNFDETEEAVEALSKMRDLIEDGVIEGIPRIGNTERLEVSLFPAVENYYEKNSLHFDKAAKKVLQKIVGKNKWGGVVGISGSAEEVKYKTKILKREFKAYRYLIRKPWQIQLAKYLTSFFKKSNLHHIIRAIEPINTYSIGVPSDMAIHGVSDTYVNTDHGQDLRDSLRESNQGLLYFLPVCEYRKEVIDDMLFHIERLSKEFNFEPAITLNPISSDVMEAVISVKFDKENTKRAHGYINALKTNLAKISIYPYRVSANDKDIQNRKIEARRALEKIISN